MPHHLTFRFLVSHPLSPPPLPSPASHREIWFAFASVLGIIPNCLSSSPAFTTSSVPSGQCPSWLWLFQDLQDQEHQEASTWVRIPSPASPFTSCPTSRYSLRSRLRALINSALCLNLSSFCYISPWAFGALPFFSFYGQYRVPGFIHTKFCMLSLLAFRSGLLCLGI